MNLLRSAFTFVCGYTRGWPAGVIVALSVLAMAPNVSAQWRTQSIQLTNGWNAVYLHVDASHTDLNAMVAADAANPILEVWRWNPSTSIQFLDDPDSPLDQGSQWITWLRSEPAPSLQSLVGNSAYLVRVGDAASTYAWNVQGKVVAPINEWTTTGLNLIGFPTVPTGAPSFESFLSQAPQLQQQAEIYQYVGGALSTNNPARLLTFRTARVDRGKAFWMRAGTTFNRYFGPFELDLQGRAGVEFGDQIHNASFFLRNLTPSSLTVSVTLLPSDTPPAGQPSIAGAPSLLLRGSLNLANFTYDFTDLPLNTARSWNLAPAGQPGSEIEVVMGLNRYAITDAPGSVLAGVLRFTDSLGFTQLEAPVSATVASRAGLWVGRASVNQVGQHLKTYLTDGSGAAVTGDDGRYITTSTNTELGRVARPYPLRLIVHKSAEGTATLLQRVFVGLDVNTNFVAATTETVLHPAMLAQARRISATHLPWSEENAPWAFDGRWNSATNLTAVISLGHDDSVSNPFLHSYHPDHDNLDATFKQGLREGAESYSVERRITLSVRPPSNDFDGLTSGAAVISGDYSETVALVGLPRAGGTNDTRTFEARGVFSLNRIADVPELTVAP